MGVEYIIHINELYRIIKEVTGEGLPPTYNWAESLLIMTVITLNIFLLI